MKTPHIILTLFLFFCASNAQAQAPVLWRERSTVLFPNDVRIPIHYPHTNVTNGLPSVMKQVIHMDSIPSFYPTRDWGWSIDSTEPQIERRFPPPEGLRASECAMSDGCMIMSSRLKDYPYYAGLWKSCDDGRTWEFLTKVSDRFDWNPDKIEVARNGMMYVNFGGGYIFRSLDKGRTWSYLFYSKDWVSSTDVSLDIAPMPESDLYVNTVLRRYDERDTVYESGGSGLFRSTNHGASWQRLDTLQPFMKRVNPRYIAGAWADVEVEHRVRKLHFVNGRAYFNFVHRERGSYDHDTAIYKTVRFDDAMLRVNADGTLDTIITGGEWFRNTMTDAKGNWYAHTFSMYGRGSIYPWGKPWTGWEAFSSSRDSGKTWSVISPMISITEQGSEGAIMDTVNPQTGKRCQALRLNTSNVFRMLPNGRIMADIWTRVENPGKRDSIRYGYYMSAFRVPLAPQVFALERGCGFHNVTFTSDTLRRVEVTSDAPWEIAVAIDTVKAGMSNRVRITSRMPGETVYFRIRAEGVGGVTEYVDSIEARTEPTYSRHGDTLRVHAGARAAYRWTLNGEPIRIIEPYRTWKVYAGDEIKSWIVMKAAGEYCCQVYDTANCVHERVACTMFGTTSVEQGERNTDIHVQPNPAMEHITVTANHTAMVEIYSALGEMMCAVKNYGREKIDITPLPSGTYYIRCTTSQGVVVKPFVIVR
ncbi:MAG: T9SS type A sorting domain-containing protein [Candidatus Kapabacteria bacterium]|nr:T9SS type A sorting domain-containing protein [Candidatus Kapabacteria bacterium]